MKTEAVDPSVLNSLPIKKLSLEVGLIFMGLILLLYGWGSMAPISSAAQAEGFVRVEGHRKKIVPMDAGVIKGIYVAENSQVEEGDLLVEFDSSELVDKIKELRKQIFKVMLDISRFSALSQERKLDIHDFEVSDELDEEAIKILSNTQALQHAQLNQYFQQHEMINQQVKQQTNKLHWDNSDLTQSIRKISLLTGERTRLETLLNSQFSSQKELNLMEIEITNISEEQIAKEASISNLKMALQSLALNQKSLVNDFYANNLKEINTLSSEKWELENQINFMLLKLARTRVLAPVKGTVINLQTHTRGEAIASGAYLMDIVPYQAPLVIEADLAAQDIELVQKGSAARVRLLNYNQRHNNPLAAEVTQVSADRFVNDKGQGFYRLLLKVDPKTLAQQSDIKLYPGMPVQALILGEKRSVMDYLLAPILIAMDKSLRE
ncbi:MAG: HlyD family type I secretion periplasmic adaptor subunit [Bermanella sp.]